MTTLLVLAIAAFFVIGLIGFAVVDASEMWEDEKHEHDRRDDS